jgi:hypothetical protein
LLNHFDFDLRENLLKGLNEVSYASSEALGRFCRKSLY